MRKPTIRHGALVGLMLVSCLALPARAQLLDMLKKLPPTGAGTKQDAPASREAVAGALPVKAPPDYESEMAPDLNCSRPRDTFSITDKLTQYGGTAATLRFQRLISTDFQYDDLKPEDQQMLRYVAQTTVWVPPEAESRLASIYDTSSRWTLRRDDGLTELDKLALDDIQQRLAKVRAAVPEYPGEIELKVDKSLSDGAFARFGGLIQLSERFLNGLGDAGPGADFLLAHEVSHVYKRHAVKLVQFKLISSAEGWDIAKRLLQSTQRSSDTVAGMGDRLKAIAAVPKLVDFVRSVQVQFGREQELEADACAAVWLKAVGTEPTLAWTRYQEVLGATTAYGPAHPNSAEREARFKTRASAEKTVAQRKTDAGTVAKQGKTLVDEARK